MFKRAIVLRILPPFINFYNSISLIQWPLPYFLSYLFLDRPECIRTYTPRIIEVSIAGFEASTIADTPQHAKKSWIYWTSVTQGASCGKLLACVTEQRQMSINVYERNGWKEPKQIERLPESSGKRSNKSGLRSMRIHDSGLHAVFYWAEFAVQRFIWS